MEFYLSKYQGGDCLKRAEKSLQDSGFALSKASYDAEDRVGVKGEFKGAIGCSSQVPTSVVFIVSGNNYQEAKKLALALKDNFMKQNTFKANDILLGTYAGISTASDSIFGIMEITKDEISWGENRYNGACKAKYKLENSYKKDNELIYKIKLEQLSCTKNTPDFQLDRSYFDLVFSLENSHNVELIEYNKKGKISGEGNFEKID